MGRLFSYDNVIFQTINKIVDCVFLSVLWILFSIPIITFGASTTALYYTVNKVIRHERSTMLKEFWRAFKSNFKQSTIIWLVLMVLDYIIIADCYLMYGLYTSGRLSIAFFILFLVVFALVTIWGIYMLSYVARFKNTTKAIMRNSAFIMIRHIIKSIALLASFLLSIALAIVVWPTILLLPVAYMFVANMILEKIFQRYMTPEDLEAEEERNRKYYN